MYGIKGDDMDAELQKLGMDEQSLRAEKFIKRKIKSFNDKYDRGRLIGKGAFGQVFECWIKGTGGREEKFALKILKKSLLSQKPTIDDLLINEFKVLMDSKHPHIVRMYDIFQDVSNFFVVQELLVGGDLYTVL
jgi:calcium-dependent protein kinase